MEYIKNEVSSVAVPLPGKDSPPEVQALPSESSSESVRDSIIEGYPSQPGCYMRQPSRCPAKPMMTEMWRHDSWAEEHGLDEAGCKDRKRSWDTKCGANDTKMEYIKTEVNIALPGE